MRRQPAKSQTIWEVFPYKLDSVDAVPMRRPRFCWTSECIENKVSGVTVTEGRYWREVHAPAAYPLQQNWLTEGYEWTGGSTGAVFPTCLKSIPRTQPPPRPAGLNKCDRATIQRWKDTNIGIPPTNMVQILSLQPTLLGGC